MAIFEKVGLFHREVTAWCHDIHAHPETAFEEQRAAALVAK
jgi:metal-dependent amidase/aminoacylase/carboxypeptidase family protein